MAADDLSALRKRLAANERLTVSEVHELLCAISPGLARTTVHRWVKAGQSPNGTQISHIKVGRTRKVHPDSVQALLAEVQAEHVGSDG